MQYPFLFVILVLSISACKTRNSSSSISSNDVLTDEDQDITPKRVFEWVRCEKDESFITNNEEKRGSQQITYVVDLDNQKLKIFSINFEDTEACRGPTYGMDPTPNLTIYNEVDGEITGEKVNWVKRDGEKGKFLQLTFVTKNKSGSTSRRHFRDYGDGKILMYFSWSKKYVPSL